MGVNYADAARQEGLEAAVWYGEQQKDLQTRFLEKWKDAENRMVASPQIHRCFEGELRKCRFEIFPYALVFRICADELQVIAVMHMSADPVIGKSGAERPVDFPFPRWCLNLLVAWSRIVGLVHSLRGIIASLQPTWSRSPLFFPAKPEHGSALQVARAWLRAKLPPPN